MISHSFFRAACTSLVVVALIAGTIGCGESEDSHEAGSVSRGQSGPVPDANLRLAVRKALDKQAGIVRSYLDVDPETVSVTASDMATLKGSFDARKGNLTDPIEDLTGLELATDLHILNLSGNNISDITPLAGLTELNYLALSRNRIADITPLAEMTWLRHLELSDNQIVDVSPLAGLTNINYILNLSNNRIVDISPLPSVAGPANLYLSGNQIVDVTPLARFTKLKNLQINNNQIVDVSPLAGLTQLSRLNLTGNEGIEDASPLCDLKTTEIEGVEVECGGQ